MMGGFLSRLFLLAFGYAYPAYECYKTVELNKPEIEQLLFWCQYWILVAFLTVLERFGDALISWLPLYNEAKLAFFIYLWYPKTKGTTYIYEGFFKPYLAKHEGEIDRNLLELRVRAVDIFALYWQKAATVSQSTFFDVLQYVANQSSRPRRAAAPKPPQATVPQQQQPPQQKKPTQIRRTLSNRQEASTSANPPPEASTIPRLRRVGSGRSGAVPVASTATDSNESTPKSAGTEPGTGFTNPEPSAPPAIIEEEEEVVEVAEEEMTVDVEEIEGEEVLAETDETPMDEAIRVTRARLRKRVATSAVAPPTPA